jgi:hypothetical protein
MPGKSWNTIMRLYRFLLATFSRKAPIGNEQKSTEPDAAEGSWTI